MKNNNSNNTKRNNNTHKHVRKSREFTVRQMLDNKRIRTTKEGLRLAVSPVAIMMLALAQYKAGPMGQRTLVGYHLKYVPFLDEAAPTPMGASSDICPTTILRDAKRKERESDGMQEVVVIGLFKTHLGAEGRPPRIRMQVARVATGNQRPWVSPVTDWNDLKFLSGSAKARHTLEVFMEREFSYNSQRLDTLYRTKTMREFHEMTAPDNERARAEHLAWLQTADVMGDTVLASSKLPAREMKAALPKARPEGASVKAVGRQLESFSKQECADILLDRHGVTPEDLREQYQVDWYARFADPHNATSFELVAALKEAGTLMQSMEVVSA